MGREPQLRTRAAGERCEREAQRNVVPLDLARVPKARWLWPGEQGSARRPGGRMMPTTQRVQGDGGTLTVLAGGGGACGPGGGSICSGSLGLRKWHERCSKALYCPDRDFSLFLFRLACWDRAFDSLEDLQRQKRREVLGCSSRRAGLDPPFRDLPRPRDAHSGSGVSCLSCFRAVLVELPSLA